MLINHHLLHLFADYFQFYLRDENSESSLEDSWADEKSNQINLAIASGAIGVGTSRNTTVPVSLEIHDIHPDDDFSMWDKVNECSIEIPSGKLVIAGCTEDFQTATRIQMVPQCYRARVYYGGLKAEHASDKDDDHYKVVLWPAPNAEVKILK